MDASGVLVLGHICRCGTPVWNIPGFFLKPSKTGLRPSSEAPGIRFLDRPNHPTFTLPPAGGFGNLNAEVVQMNFKELSVAVSGRTSLGRDPKDPAGY